MSQEKIRILLVEDDYDDAFIMKRAIVGSSALAHNDIFECQHVDHLAAALDYLSDNDVDIVLTDLTLPDSQGTDTLLTQIKAHPNVPFIVVSGNDDEHKAIELVKSGAQDYLIKGASLGHVDLKRVIPHAIERHQLRMQLEKERAAFAELFAAIKAGRVDTLSADTPSGCIRLLDSELVKENERLISQLTIANQKLEDTNHQLKNKTREIQSFYHTLCHELRTPLTSTREFLSIINDGIAGPITDDQEKYLGFCLEGCDQVVVLINDLLDVARLESGKLTIECCPLNIFSIIEKVFLAKRTTALEKKIEFKFNCKKNLPLINADNKRIIQIITNLVDNAFKFTSAGGKININVTLNKNNNMLINVTDTGRGIPQEQLDDIFHRLYQVQEDDASKNEGLGLGLNICKELVQLHQGHITVTSQVGQGTTFSIELPTCNNIDGEADGKLCQAG